MVLMRPNDLAVLEAGAPYNTVLEILHHVILAVIDAWRERPATRDAAVAACAAIRKAHGRSWSCRTLWAGRAFRRISGAVAYL